MAPPGTVDAGVPPSGSEVAGGAVLRPPPPMPPANLRLNIACAEDDFVTPDDGLTVSVDGNPPLSTRGADTATVTGYTRNWNTYSYEVPTDYAYRVQPGQHTLLIGVPGCKATSAAIEIPPDRSLTLEGRLLPQPGLRGPVDAPDGLTIGLGGFSTTVLSATRGGAITDASGAPFGAYALETSWPPGLAFWAGYEHRYFTFRFDLGVGWAAYSGLVTAVHDEFLPGGSGSFAMTGTMWVVPLDLRVGVRLPFRYVAPAIGTGIGGALWIPGNPTYAQTPPSGFPSAPAPDVTGAVELPLWVSVEVKPFCSFGFEFDAAHNFDLNLGESTNVVRGGLFYQPSAACSDQPYLHVAGR